MNIGVGDQYKVSSEVSKRKSGIKPHLGESLPRKRSLDVVEAIVDGMVLGLGAIAEESDLLLGVQAETECLLVEDARASDRSLFQESPVLLLVLSGRSLRERTTS